MTTPAKTQSEEKTKFTPGPWGKPVKGGDGNRISVRAEGDGWKRLDVTVYSDDCDSDTAMANAVLIHAAPDLLKAAKRALTVLKAQGESVRPSNALGALEAAIAKAQGGAL